MEVGRPVLGLVFVAMLPQCGHRHDVPGARHPPMVEPKNITTAGPTGWVRIEHTDGWSIRLPPEFEQQTWNIDDQQLWRRGRPLERPTRVVFGDTSSQHLDFPRADCRVNGDECSVFETHRTDAPTWASDFYIDVAVRRDKETLVFVSCSGPAEAENVCWQIVGTLGRRTR